MASAEHLKLSEEVKNVHLWLRTRAQEVGPEQAWSEHLERKDVLQNYAASMKTLAVEHWAKINQGERKSLCRIEWIAKTVECYFLKGIMDRELKKEALRLNLDYTVASLMSSSATKDKKLKLLDVGSCYNPFQSYSLFETYPIDLCPADEECRQCNFLDVSVIKEVTDDWFTSPVVSVPHCFFDTVVFCLFLEYLPCPELRLKACKLAWECLKLNGVLVIVTPDSNHQTAHSALMKEWMLALIRIGFVRLKIEKLKYLYCMAFRKTIHASELLSLHRYQCDYEPRISIPQDFVDYSIKQDKSLS